MHRCTFLYERRRLRTTVLRQFTNEAIMSMEPVDNIAHAAHFSFLPTARPRHRMLRRSNVVYAEQKTSCGEIDSSIQLPHEWSD
jgi:hypothetical protein